MTQLKSFDFVDRLVGTAHSRVRGGLERLDLTNEGEVQAAIKRWEPDLVIHAAAERRPDRVEEDPSLAERLNVGSTETLARLTAERGALFIYISTDYVFDGQRPPYRTDSETNPLNNYGKMKLQGELAVRRAFAGAPSSWAILRIPILYGDVENLEESPVTELAIKLLNRNPFTAENWASRYPAHAEDVGRAVVLIARRLIEGEGGVYHFAGPERFTKYEMARTMAEVLGIDGAMVQADNRPPAGAPRPKDCRLDGSRLEALGFTPAIRFKEGIHRTLAPFL
jgi:dTDP-4-dehydrorhamnose reductase